jgi:acetyl esterase/lipase
LSSSKRKESKEKLYFEFDKETVEKNMKPNEDNQKIKENDKGNETDKEYLKQEDNNESEDDVDSNENLAKNEKLKFMKIVMFSPENVRLQYHEKQSVELRKIKRVILHYHGGGFICMSYKSHQRYLRYSY